MIATVTVDIAHHHVNHDFDYRVPKEMHDYLEIGQRVLIPFGVRTLSGIVTGLKRTSTIKNLRPIRQILDFQRIFSEEMLALSLKQSWRYATPRIEYLHAMLPSAMKMTYQKYLRVHRWDALSDELKKCFKNKKEKKFDATFDAHLKELKAAIHEEYIEIITHVSQRQKTPVDEYVMLTHEEKVRGDKQKALIDYLKTHPPVLLPTLLETTNASRASLNSLVKKGVVSILSREKYRELHSLIKLRSHHVELNDEQTHAFNAIENALGEHQTFLLHGITSSGKTEVYIKLAERVLKQGKSVIILVPEINLTPHLSARFKARFHDQVAVYHSRLTVAEQYDEWRRLKTGKAQIVIGARSAIFAPLETIGLIVMDEEHSDAYIQEDTPRYHAFDIAKDRAIFHSAPLVLGSATPKVESYYYALSGKYTLLKLTHRALESVLPTMHIVDMKKEFLAGNLSMLSATLHEAIAQRLLKKEQVLILINRRGHANFVLCRSCGKTIACEHCEISYTYHQTNHQLKCHYCNHQQPMVKRCPNCQSEHIRYMGIGSEKVAQYLKTHFPEAVVQRMDSDTTKRRLDHEQILYDFEASGDILVGTQMISKGLDFPKVTLVAVLSADMSLYVPSYYAHEDTYALITQMGGRSGRRDTLGEVIIQSYNPDHPVLLEVIRQDYQTFYNREITLREEAKVVPFKQMTLCTLSGETYNSAFMQAMTLIKLLKKTLPKETKIIGPIKPKIVRRRTRYHSEVLIKHSCEEKLLTTLHDYLKTLDWQKNTLQITHQPRTL